MITLAIDPGEDQGWATIDGSLVGCGLGEPQGTWRRLIVERPTVYHRGKVLVTNIPPATIITLALRAGEAIGKYATCDRLPYELVEPRTWKGSVSKDIHHRRVWDALTPAEQEIVKAAARTVRAKSKHHNILDAIALGLYAVGRGV